MNCKNCGTENPEDAQYCAKCGTAMTRPPQQEGAVPPPLPPQASPQQEMSAPPPPPYQEPPPSYQTPPPQTYQAPPQQPQQNIPNYLVWSIITTICCCLPLGIFAIIKSAEVNTKLASFDYAGAKSASDLARTLNLIGTIVGFVIQAIYFTLVAIGAVAGIGESM